MYDIHISDALVIQSTSQIYGPDLAQQKSNTIRNDLFYCRAFIRAHIEMTETENTVVPSLANRVDNVIKNMELGIANINTCLNRSQSLLSIQQEYLEDDKPQEMHLIRAASRSAEKGNVLVVAAGFAEAANAPKRTEEEGTKLESTQQL